MRSLATTLAATLALAPLTAVAQPKTKAPAGKDDAKALMASGLKLFQAGDYLGALTVFREAYTRFNSAKILLNIGTTLSKLGRNAEAANTYQRYLDAEDTDPTKRADVLKVIGDLDVKVGSVEVTVQPADAEVQIGGDETWHPASKVSRVRVEPGKVLVKARADKFTAAEKTVDVGAGKKVAVALELVAIPDAPVVTAPPVVVAPPTEGGEIDRGAEPTKASPLGAYVVANIDVTNKGGAARVAVTFELLPRLQLEAGGIIGASPGAYAGARYAFLPGRFRPLLAVGAPVFIKDGARFAARGAAGLEVVLSPRISVVVEAGVERVFNPAMNYVDTMFVPSIGAAGRL